MPDDARAITHELDDWMNRLMAEWISEEGMDETSSSAEVRDMLRTENARLRSLNAELLAVVKRTLSLFEALNLDVDECARIRELVERAEKP